MVFYSLLNYDPINSVTFVIIVITIIILFLYLHDHTTQLQENKWVLALHHQQNTYTEAWLIFKHIHLCSMQHFNIICFSVLCGNFISVTDNLELLSTYIIKLILSYATGVWDHLQFHFTVSLTLLTTSMYFQGRSVKYLLVNSLVIFWERKESKIMPHKNVTKNTAVAGQQ